MPQTRPYSLQGPDSRVIPLGSPSFQTFPEEAHCPPPKDSHTASVAEGGPATTCSRAFRPDRLGSGSTFIVPAFRPLGNGSGYSQSRVPASGRWIRLRHRTPGPLHKSQRRPGLTGKPGATKCGHAPAPGQWIWPHSPTSRAPRPGIQQRLTPTHCTFQQGQHVPGPWIPKPW